MELFEFKENKVNIRGIDIFYKTAGEGKPLLILHGWGASSFSWLGVIERMAGRGFKLIVPDLPGFGKSGFPSNAWGIAGYADLIMSFMQDIGVSEYYLLGHSFGGGIALRMIAEKGAKAKKLILCDSAIVRKERLDARQKTSKFLAKVGSKIISKNSFLYSFFEKMAYRLAGSYDYYRANPIMKEVFKKVISEDLTHLLDKIKMPCLIIWGGDDVVTPMEDAVLFNEIIKGSELKIIDGARHNPYKTNPDEVSEAIIKFLNK